MFGAFLSACKLPRYAGAVGISLLALTSAAWADGYDEGGAPPPVVDEGRKFTYSFNIGGTSDYVFRGISQSSNDPVLQGGADVGYGIFYAGTWASGVDFDNAPPANAEVDWYAGVRPTWQSPLGPMNLDFGAIYYSYPGADPAPGADPNYWELKAGYSWSVLHPSLTTGTTVFWSPNYFAETGSVWTIETYGAWTLPKVGTPTSARMQPTSAPRPISATSGSSSRSKSLSLKTQSQSDDVSAGKPLALPAFARAASDTRVSHTSAIATPAE